MNFTEHIFRPIKRLKFIGRWFPERSANFYSVLSRESDRTLCSLGVSTSQYSTWFAFDAAALGFDVSNNRLRFADVQGIRLPFN